MPRPSFKNIGLRRDLNLSDLQSKDQALNNVLNNLVVGSDNKSFMMLIKLLLTYQKTQQV